MNIATVTEVIGIATKKDGSEIRGSKNGKDWVMYSVILDNGVKLNVFGPVKVGDTVYDLEQDPQYHTWKGKVRQPNAMTPKHDSSQPTNAQLMEGMTKIYKLMEEVHNHITNKPSGMTQYEFNQTVLDKPKDVVLEDVDDSFDYDSIPF